MIPRSVLPSFAALRTALLLASALFLHAPSTHAAPTSASAKQCIAAAESGQQHRSRGRLRDAREAFGVCTASTCPAVVRRDCGRWIEEIDAATPSVIVKLEDENGREVPDGQVLVDGEPLQRGLEGRASLVDPGVHKFVWQREGGPFEQEAVVREGEHNRVIVIRGPKRTPAATGPEPADRAPAATATTTRSPLPWVIGGIGLALAAGGGVFWGIGLNDRANLESSCAAAHRCQEGDVDASRTKLLIGDVLLGAGAVAVATAVIILLTQSGPVAASASR